MMMMMMMTTTIYLLTAIGLTPCGSSTVHIYTQTIHRTTQLTILVRRLSGIRTQSDQTKINPLNAELNPICHLLALLGAHHIFHVSRIVVNDELTA